MPLYSRGGRAWTPTALLGLALVSLTLWFVGRGARSVVDGGPLPPGYCDYETPEGCPEEPTSPMFPTDPAPATAPAPTKLEASRICPSSGYLCAGLEQRGALRVLRWDEATPEIKIRIPRPTGEATDAALRLQQAAARGISVWNGHPLTLRVVLSDRPADEDFVVRWGATLGGMELGRVETRWVQRGLEATLEVREFALSTRSPHQSSETLDPAQVTLTAAHEMGHALGLPHSDSERDVMFPTNTARSLSTRDFRTMEALYSLENGAEIRTGG